MARLVHTMWLRAWAGGPWIARDEWSLAAPTHYGSRWAWAVDYDDERGLEGPYRLCEAWEVSRG